MKINSIKLVDFIIFALSKLKEYNSQPARADA